MSKNTTGTSEKLQFLTQKALQEAIKRGDTLKDLRAKYSCTNKKLFARIERLYRKSRKQTPQKIWAALEANGKKHRPASGHPKKTPSEATRELPTPQPETLDSLQTWEAQLTAELKGLPDTITILSSQRDESIGDLGNLYDRLKQLLSDLQNCKVTYDQTVQAISGYDRRIEQAIARRDTIEKELGDVRQKIKDATPIQLYAYADGRIETNDPEFIVGAAYLETVAAQLYSRDECAKLVVRDIHTLARLLMATQDIKRPIELVCETEELETAFWALHGVSL